jgi:Na+-driven multidrug efflux pump
MQLESVFALPSIACGSSAVVLSSTPTVSCNIYCFWLAEIALAYILARPLGLGASGVFWSVAIAFSSMAVVSGLLLRRGRWKLKRV